ncbi:MAG: hypothetical protein GY715_13655 [Planctomycetes bacterium]|nr:hypothetical protein [Planctomycetota bacterium]
MPRRFLCMLPAISVIALAGCRDDSAGPADTPAATQAATETPAKAAPADAAPADDILAEGPITPDADTDDLFRVKDAERLLDEVMRVYRDAPAFTDLVVQESWLLNREEDLREYTVRAGKGKNIYLKQLEAEFMWIDGEVYGTAAKRPERYLHVPGSGDLLQTCDEKFGGFVSPARLHLVLRYGRSREEIIDAMDLSAPDRSKISSYRRKTNKQGRELEVISLISASGSARYSIDPETKLIVEAEVEWTPETAPEGFVITKHLVFHPEIHDELPEPIAFEPGDRMRVMKIPHLLGRKAGPSTPPATAPSTE